MSQVNFRIVNRSVQLGDKQAPPSGPNEVNGKPVTSRGIIGFLGGGGELIWVLFLTEDSGVPPATIFAVPPTGLLYLPDHLLSSWLTALQVAQPTIGSIDFDHPERTGVGTG
jgi:hypothetical protein